MREALCGGRDLLIDKIIDIILEFAREIVPWTVVNAFSAGIILRWGKYHRTLTPGFYLKIPFADRVYEDVVLTTTLELPPQTLTTKDGKQVVVKTIIKYDIPDIKLFMLSVYDAKDAMGDISQGIIKKTIAALNWEECNDNELDNTVTKKVRAELKKWGLNIQSCTFTNIGLIRSIRLFNDKEIHGQP